jgi:hypothetical protein
VFLLLAAPASATLKPLGAGIHPVGNRATTVYKTTPEGGVNIDLYFPSN